MPELANALMLIPVSRLSSQLLQLGSRQICLSFSHSQPSTHHIQPVLALF